MTILQALTSLVARTIVKPMEVLTSGISKSTRNLFSEIPAQWQPIFFLVFVVILIIAVMGYFGYKISIPFVLSIEPAKPAQETNNPQGKSTSAKKYQWRRENTRKRYVRSVGTLEFGGEFKLCRNQNYSRLLICKLKCKNFYKTFFALTIWFWSVSRGHVKLNQSWNNLLVAS